MITIEPVHGLPEVRPGDDLAGLIAALARLRDGDVVVVSQKVVSKAEGALERPHRGEGRMAARRRLARAVARRVVADSEHALIVETHHGFVCANAGIDASNVLEGALSLLPEDPDRSARHLREGLHARTGAWTAVVVADTFGRPWRNGQTDVAIGVAGLPPLRDERGGADAVGQPLTATVVAVADEVAAAADLVRSKADGVPVVVLRGLVWTADADARAGALVRARATDLFPRGRGMLARHLAGDGPAADVEGPIPEAAWQRAAQAARHTGGPGLTVTRDGGGLAVSGEPLAAGAGAVAAVAALTDLGHAAGWRPGPGGGALVRPGPPRVST